MFGEFELPASEAYGLIAAMIMQPRAAPVTDRDQWHGLVMLHLRTGMPDTGQTSGNPIVSAACHIVRHTLHHILNRPNFVSGIGAFSAADNPRPSTVRVSAGSMTPSSQSRALA